ncbi:MAG: hypothetical protein ABW088_05330 [Sedimenticola sp.]
MKDIESAKVIFLDTNQEYFLCTKPNSNCHFFEKFEIGQDTIQLRLDWSDLDADGFPILDADFYSSDTGKKRKLKGRRKDSHHVKALDDQGRTYEWEFEEYKLKFKVVVVVSASVTESMCLGDLCSASIIKAPS